jgi:hypothetical protein
MPHGSITCSSSKLLCMDDSSAVLDTSWALQNRQLRPKRFPTASAPQHVQMTLAKSFHVSAPTCKVRSTTEPEGCVGFPHYFRPDPGFGDTVMAPGREAQPCGS